MKFIKFIWKKLTLLEKIALPLTLAAVLFTAAVYCDWFSKLHCPICCQHPQLGQDYFLDMRTGELLPVEQYLNGESDALWFSKESNIPQEISLTNQCGYVRFPTEADNTAEYCSDHRPPYSISECLYVLSKQQSRMICYAVSGEGIKTPDGHTVVKRFNNTLNCWELAVFW